MWGEGDEEGQKREEGLVEGAWVRHGDENTSALENCEGRIAFMIL